MKLVCIKDMGNKFIYGNIYTSSCRNDDELYSVVDEFGETWYFSKYKLFDYFTMYFENKINWEE